MIERTRVSRGIGVGAAFALGFTFTLYLPTEGPDRDAEADAFGVVGAAKIERLYERWVDRHEATGGDANVELRLAYRKGLSAEFTQAAGSVTLDLESGRVSAVAEGLPGEAGWRLWLVDQRIDAASAGASDVTLDLGAMLARDGGLAIESDLGPGAFRDFQVDLVVVAREGATPAEGTLFGAPGVFQSLYTSLRSPRLLAVSEFAKLDGVVLEGDPSYRFGVPVARAAATEVDPDVLFDSLVARGADLFINETFRGNGRTCATCHGSKENFALNVTDVASRRDDDPLFAAEFVPALAFTPDGPKFEVPVLMRGNALIVENQDGMDDLANNFNMRGVPHTLALQTSLQSSLTPPFDTPGFAQATGWSGDGSPNGGIVAGGVAADGSLLFFAAGAVVQHFPLTLARVPGVDFRLPTLFELQAMEAFQLSLGRDVDLVLPLALVNPVVARGQELFQLVGPGNPNCNVCHFNAGAAINPNVVPEPGANFNFDTGVEAQPDRPTQIILQAAGLDISPDFDGLFSLDGGFGGPGNPGNLVNDVANGFGNRAFNTATLVEAADTGGFFHDNSVSTIEAAVEFYNSDSFNDSQGGALTGGINMAATQVQAISSFLRVVNALENLRSVTELVQAAQDRRVRRSTARELLLQALAELEDARQVLAAADLQPGAVRSIDRARDLVDLASDIPSTVVRRVLTDQALDEVRRANADMVSPAP